MRSMKALLMLALAAFGSAPLASSAADNSNDPSVLATDLWKASGGENWSNVKELRFTFEVEADGKTVASAKHDWNVAGGTDHVQWKDKDGNDKDATADLKSPPQDGDGKKAFARWVNDSYWLLAPLKIRDPGVTVTPGTQKELNGTMCDTLHLSFGQVGLTPTDQYLLYVDPGTKLLRAWDYMPKEGGGMQATWEKYEKFGGLTLATEHHFNDKTIKLTGIEVVAGK
jgi:hypothetical protein